MILFGFIAASAVVVGPAANAAQVATPEPTVTVIEDRMTRDYVELYGVVYFPAYGPGRTIQRQDLGPEVGRVADQTFDVPWESVCEHAPAGSSSVLPAGTPLYSLVGYISTFRLAAERDGELVLFEAACNGNAKVGGDLLDLTDKVARISVHSGESGFPEVASIDDPAEVARLVELVVTGPVDPELRLYRGQMPTPTRTWLAFHFLDGTATSYLYFQPAVWEGIGIVGNGGILVPPRFGEAIDAALAG
jgi:hypothetical protein